MFVMKKEIDVYMGSLFENVCDVYVSDKDGRNLLSLHVLCYFECTPKDLC